MYKHVVPVTLQTSRFPYIQNKQLLPGKITISHHLSIHHNIEDIFIVIACKCLGFFDHELNFKCSFFTCIIIANKEDLIIAISTDLCKRDVTPLLTHWSYISFALSHRYHVRACRFGIPPKKSICVAICKHTTHTRESLIHEQILDNWPSLLNMLC